MIEWQTGGRFMAVWKICADVCKQDPFTYI